jgi:hypothetical protein
MPEPAPVVNPISDSAKRELDKLVADLPSTGRGAINFTATQDGLKVDFAQRFNRHVTSSAYWQKTRSGSATWGAKASVQW